MKDKQKHTTQDRMLGEHGTTIEMARELKECKNEFLVGKVDKMGTNRKYFKHYEQNGYKYRIAINFYDDNSSVDDKMKVMNMIDKYNVNHRVGKIGIQLKNNNKWN